MSFQKRRAGMFLAIGGLVIALIVVNFLFNKTGSSGESSLDSLLKTTVNGQIVDVDSSIGVDDISDITYRWKDDKVTIYFGKVTMEFKREELVDPNIVTKMGGIGLVFKGDKLYYNNQEVSY